MYSKMKDFKAEFRKIGIVPVVVLDDAKDAAPLAKALVERRTQHLLLRHS